jgi:hypothetical protein
MSKLKASALTCFALLMISHANAQETAIEQNNTRVSIYLHPVSSYVSTFGLSPIYLTVEVPFSLSNSLIIRPSIFDLNRSKRDIFRLGSDIGFRHHLAREGEGLYLQGQMGIFYYERNVINSDGMYDPFPSIHGPLKNIWLDAMGYVGHSFKFSRVSLFIDVGIGIGRSDILLDANFGIGIPFGAVKPVNEQKEHPEQEPEPEPEQDNTRVSVYLHPFFFLLGILEEENRALLIYSTIEIPFNLKRSLIVKPSFVKRNEQSRQFRAGSDIGIRNYYKPKGEGFYGQMQTGVFYHDANNLFPEISTNSSIWFDIMGYSGYSKKFSNVSVFADIGFGLGSLFGIKCNANECFSLFPIIDVNFGIGIPF